MEIDIIKICSQCLTPMELSFFNKDKTHKDGHASVCRFCQSKKNKEWYSKNKTSKNAQSKEWRTQNPDRMKDLVKKWVVANHEKEKSRLRKVSANRRSTPCGKLNNNMSCAINRSLCGAKSRCHWEDLVGYTVDQLKTHLEKQFVSGMTWGNRKDWHIDHKIPIAVFNFNSPDDLDFKRCWALKNLRPMWKRDNQQKGAKISAPFQPSLSFSC